MYSIIVPLPHARTQSVAQSRTKKEYFFGILVFFFVGFYFTMSGSYKYAKHELDNLYFITPNSYIYEIHDEKCVRHANAIEFQVSQLS